MTLALQTCFVHRFTKFAPICNKYAPICNNSTSFCVIKIAPICNNSENHSANSFQRGFMGIRIFQIPRVKIYSLGYTLVDYVFLEKHLYVVFKSSGLEMSHIAIDLRKPPKPKQASNIFDSFETHLGPFNNYITLKIEIFASHLVICVLCSTF